MNEELKIMKKKYGEKMAHFCRDNFPTILETDGLLLKLLLDNFEPSHDLYEDIIEQNKETEFKNYIYSLVDVEKDNKIKVIKTPEELLSEVGYNLYECKCEEDIQKFKKYYASGEELCTFNGGRLNRCYVFFAVKKNASDIKRKNFPNPQRQDTYGTSVLSIQFTKDKSHTLSIKNRYNHTVNNPDSTYSNNLDNIIDGLTESFSEYYGLIQQHSNGKFELRDYVRASDGKYYKYNLEIDNVYYCPNNIIIDNSEVKRYDKEKYLIFDYFILNLETKKIKKHIRENDGFIHSLGKIKKITITNRKDYKELLIYNEDGFIITINLDKDNNIIMVNNPYIRGIKENYLFYNRKCQRIYLSNVERISYDFMSDNNDSLEEIFLPKCETIGNDFLYFNNKLKSISLPNVTFIGSNFLWANEKIESVSLPKCREIKDNFLYYNFVCKKIDMPRLEKVGANFMTENGKLETINLPSLVSIGDDFLYDNDKIKTIYLPNVTHIGNNFLPENMIIEDVYLPKCCEVKHDFLYFDIACKKLDMPMLEKTGKNFMYKNRELEIINLPSLVSIQDSFLYNNDKVKILYLPNLISIINFKDFKVIKYLYAPKLERVSDISLLKDIPYCYTPLLKEYCNTEDLIFDCEQLSLELKDNLNRKSR